VSEDADSIASDSGIALDELKFLDETDDLLGLLEDFPLDKPPEPTKEELQEIAGMPYI
jgi:hypothetical protein